MSGLLPDKVLNIFLHIPAYENDGFRMWGFILKKYNPRVKDALFDSISDLYTLNQGPAESISIYMSHAHRLLSRLRGITFNTMANLFMIVNFDRSRFGALVNRFHYCDPEVINADVDSIKTLLGTIESLSRVIDGPPMTKPSALRGSAPIS